MPKLLLGNAEHNNVNTSLRHIVLESIFDILNLKQSEVQFIPLRSNSKTAESRRLLKRSVYLQNNHKKNEVTRKLREISEPEVGRGLSSAKDEPAEVIPRRRKKKKVLEANCSKYSGFFLMQLNINDITKNYTHDMSISENKNNETIPNARGPLQQLSQRQMGHYNSTYALQKKACYKHSATNTTSDVSQGSSNCLSFPMELVISPTIWKGITENLNCYYEDDCSCRNRKWPYLHMDTISKLRLKSLVKSIYDDKRNSNLFKPPSCPFDDEPPLSTCFLKPRKKRIKCKKRKGCCCKRNPSIVSLHLNWPKCGGSRKSSCCKKKKKRQARSPVRAACPYSAANSIQDSCPPTKTGTKAISLTLGNQKIVISLEDDPGVGCSVNKDLSCLVKSTQAIDEKPCRPRSRKRSISYNTRSSSSTRRPRHNTPKTCECLDKLKTKIAENLIRLISNKVTGCNESCKSRRTQSKVDTCTCTSSRVSNSTFEIDLDEEESRSCFQESPPRSRSRQKKSNPCCGCRKKKKSRQNICPPSWPDNHSRYKNVVISVNSGPPDKIRSCCCKNCSNEKKRYSSAGPPVEYVYLQEERTGSTNRAAVNSGSSSMNSQNDDRQYDNNSSGSANNRENIYQFRSKQGVFLQNETALALQPTILMENAREKHSHECKEKLEQAAPSPRIRNDFIPFDTKSEGTTISETSNLILEKSVTYLSNNKQNFKVSNDDDNFNRSTSKLICKLKKNYGEVRNMNENKNEFFYNETEKLSDNSTKYRYKYIPRITRYTKNSEDARNESLFSIRDQNVQQKCTENTVAKNYHLEDSKCDELNKLLLEIQSYWQMNSSNLNIFEDQGKFFDEREKEVDDGFVESINDDLDDADFWKNPGCPRSSENISIRN
ncbi:hypothetical protein WA026_011000 [Henosepilachna vigintioctopunctata]|uniref:Uncharacterized protein n=1 Tax=Henosepilachna vigintioctopunctata TaxID=420089 RepID=A0AAW1UPT1_9CUCU